MSIIGRTIIGYTVNSPLLNRVADLSGSVLSSISGTRYQAGRLRVAYKISEQVKAGDRVVFCPGKVTSPDGKIIAEHPVLNCPEAMGEITVRPVFSTPEGMSRFLKHIYSKHDQWGMTFSDKIQQLDREELNEATRWAYGVLDIKPDKGISVDVRPLKEPTKTYLAQMMVISVLMRFSVPVALTLSGKLKVCHGTFQPLFSITDKTYQPRERNIISVTMGSIKQQAFVHELAHLLASYGCIRNDIIANSLSYLFLYRHSSPDDAETDIAKFDNPLEYLKTIRLWYSYEFPKSYQTGTELGQLAACLSKQTGDPETKFRFIRMVANHTTSQDLIGELQGDPEFKPFFTPKGEMSMTGKW